MNNSNGKFHSLHANEKINVRFRLVIAVDCRRRCAKNHAVSLFSYMKTLMRRNCVVLPNESAASARDSMLLWFLRIHRSMSNGEIECSPRAVAKRRTKMRWKTPLADESNMHNVRRLKAPTPLCMLHVSQLRRTNSRNLSSAHELLQFCRLNPAIEGP